MLPITTVQVQGNQAESVLKLMELFDDHDDVQNLWSNFDIPDEQ